MKKSRVYKSNIPHFIWIYRGNNPFGMFGRTVEKFVNHEPQESDLQTFLLGYHYPYKLMQSMVYCLIMQYQVIYEETARFTF